MHNKRSTLFHAALLSSLAVVLSGCATLPTSGPTGRAVKHDAAGGGFRLIDISDITALPPPPKLAEFVALPPSARPALATLAPGDVISVTVYEIGARLFSGGDESSLSGTIAFDPAARAQRIGPLEIDADGWVRLPYLGKLKAAGYTPDGLARQIEAGLHGKSEHPQALVTLTSAIGSAVIIGGEVAAPGRIKLSSAHEKLLDVIALAGGHRGKTADLTVRITRQGNVSEGPLERLAYGNIGGMAMEPGDRVEIFRQPRTYSVLGSVLRVNQVDLPTRQVSLVDALALAGGPNESVADPAAVFVFRYLPAPDGQGPDMPVVYHINMLKPASYFLAQKFILDNHDVIYVGGAEANQPSKLLQVIGQVFTPAIIARQLVR